MIGLTLSIHNKGDTPAYPHTLEAYMDSENYSGLLLPSVISPDEIKNIDCFIYKENSPEDPFINVSLKGSLGKSIGYSSFSVVIENNVPTKEF